MWVEANKNLADIPRYKPGLPIEEAKRKLNLKRVVKLASNENPFSPSPLVVREIRKYAANINRYPESNCFYLRRAICRKMRIKESHIIFGNGSDEIITLALRAFVREGDEVIIGEPTFLIYKIQSLACGARLVIVPHKEYTYDLDSIKKKITRRTKIIFIANPENPLGTYIDSQRVRNFLESVPSSVLVFFDEAYFEFAPSDFPHTLEFIKRGRKNIIFTRTFSKAYALAGLRIGYGIASREIIENLQKVREPFNVNSLAQKAALAAMQDGKWLRKIIDYIKNEKRFLYHSLDKIGLFYIRSATNFIIISTLPRKNVASLLLKKGVIVRDMSNWGMRGFIRVSVGKRRENLAFLRALKEIWPVKKRDYAKRRKK